MTPQDATRLLTAVQKDDLGTFSTLYNKKKGVCWGRFPLPSVCILYGARRILRAYGTDMPLSGEVVEEPLSLYTQFARSAGKALRLWVGNTETVHPLAMLAVLGRRRDLLRLYPRYDLTEGQKRQVVDAYRLRFGKVPTFENGTLRLPPKPISKGWDRLVVLVCVLTLLAAATVGTGVGLATSIRKGHLQRVFTVRSEADLAAWWQSDKPLVLAEDITLSAPPVANPQGRLDGKGHTLTLVGEESMWTTFGGTLSNLTLRLVSNQPGTVGALLCHTLTGRLENVKIVVDNLSLALSESHTATGVLCVENKGSIVGCTLSGDLTVSGTSAINGHAGWLCADNDGLIEGCTLSDNLLLETVDGGALVGENRRGGIIRNCTVSGDCTQLTEEATWSPRLGGICGTNYGNIESCTVTGNVGIQHNHIPNPLATSAQILLGGVAGANYGTVSHVYVGGDLFAEGQITSIYVGGICGINDQHGELVDGVQVTYTGQVQDCIVSAHLRATGRTFQEGDPFNLYSFVGGISGGDVGNVLRCFFTGNATVVGNYPYAGGLVGWMTLDRARSNGLAFVAYSGLYYVPSEVCTYAVALVQSSNTLSPGGNIHGTAPATIAQITEMEGYWYGK